MPTEFVCGEWQHLNRERSAKNMAVAGITAAANALIDTGEKRRTASGGRTRASAKQICSCKT